MSKGRKGSSQKVNTAHHTNYSQ